MNQEPSRGYHVYGRKTYPQPLTFIGQLEISDAAGLARAVHALAGEDDWVELIAIPEASITPVIRGGNPV